MNCGPWIPLHCQVTELLQMLMM